MQQKLKVCKVHREAVLPTRAYEHDAGYDLYSNEDIELKPGQHHGIATGISMAVPKGHVGLIWDKSGIAIKHGLKTKAGVIDAGYRGEVVVGMINLSDKVFKIEKGMKVAQILIQEVKVPEIEEVDSLDETERADQGFGSSGK